jgi:hypothetical protein
MQEIQTDLPDLPTVNDSNAQTFGAPPHSGKSVKTPIFCLRPLLGVVKTWTSRRQSKT